MSKNTRILLAGLNAHALLAGNEDAIRVLEKKINGDPDIVPNLVPGPPPPWLKIKADRGSRQCTCGRTISANAAMCGKCAGVR